MSLGAHPPIPNATPTESPIVIPIAMLVERQTVKAGFIPTA